MFCPEGDLTLSEISELFAAYAQGKIPAQSQSESDEFRGIYRDTDTETKAYSDWLMMSFMIVFAPDIRVVLSSGFLVRIEPRLFYPDIEFDFWRYYMMEEFVNRSDCYVSQKLSGFPEDHVGRIQAADFSILHVDMQTMTFRRPPHTEKSLRKAEKVLDKMPLCIALNSLPPTVEAAVSKIESSIRSFWFPDENSLPDTKHRTSHLIVDAMRAGQVVKKSEAKRQFGRGMKTEEFNATWREVSQIIPEASKPGPRPRKNNS